MFGIGKLFSGSKSEPKLYAPVRGTIIPTDKIPDPTFAESILGPTLGIDPAEGVVRAPCDGVITQIFRTGHAVTLTSKDGVEILIHVGINTVDLKGEGFSPKVVDDQEVKKGDELITFDLKLIAEKGFSTIVPIVICNAQDFEKVTFTKSEGEAGDDTEICTVQPKK